jgi:hypothetical protein
MNIFVLDLDPEKCARYHCDRHISKMCVEHCQILGSIAYTARGIQRKADISTEFIEKTFKGFPRKKDGKPFPYGIGYRNHPCTQWAGKTLDNYRWLTFLTAEMCYEYTRRYGKKHACEEINRWYASNHPELSLTGMTPFAQAMPDSCKNPDAVKAYRQYYKEYKAKFAKWAHSETPDWWQKITF